MADARRGEFSVVLVAAFDRIARSTKNFLEIVDELHELGGVLLEHLNSMTAQEQFNLNRHNFLMVGNHDYGPDPQDKLASAFAEAWAWLERECLIALKPNASGSCSYFITRRGQKLIDRNAYEAYRRASMLPRSLLHPRVESRVYPSFLRGAYDTAVFEALREVEVAVRDAAGFGPDSYEVDLMRDAFNPAKGPLADRTSLKSEQEAMSNLFARRYWTLQEFIQSPHGYCSGTFGVQ